MIDILPYLPPTGRKLEDCEMDDNKQYGLQLFILIAVLVLVVGITRL
jgi:hypothetical protein